MSENDIQPMNVSEPDSWHAGRAGGPMASGGSRGWLETAVVAGAIAIGIASVADASLLYGTAVNTNAVASSFYNAGFGVNNLFDNDVSTQWAISGYNGANPQGADQAWFSFTLDQVYTLDAIRFAPRNVSGQTDGIDTINVWIGTTSFGVDVTNATSTNNFLGTATAVTWTQSNFTSAAAQNYTLGTPLQGQYVLVQLINTTDPTAPSNRNIGAREFVFSGVVPSAVPGSGLAASGTLGLAGVARRRRR